MSVNTFAKETVATKKRVLVIDDDANFRDLIKRILRKNEAFELDFCKDGKEGIAFLKEMGSKIDIILCDYHMPEANGYEVLQEIKNDPVLQAISVVILTSEDSIEKVKELLDLGAYYYLKKPANREILSSVLAGGIEATIRFRNLLKIHEAHLCLPKLLQVAKFEFSNFNDLQLVTHFLSNCFPSPKKVLKGIYELLLNAHEHGNLKIGQTDKETLILSGKWEDELLKRETLPENKDKRVEVIYKKEEDGIHLQITDMGKGFDWRRYLNIDPSSVNQACGRGIILAKTLSFDKMLYNESGNRVTVTTAFSEGDYWD